MYTISYLNESLLSLVWCGIYNTKYGRCEVKYINNVSLKVIPKNEILNIFLLVLFVVEICIPRDGF